MLVDEQLVEQPGRADDHLSPDTRRTPRTSTQVHSGKQGVGRGKSERGKREVEELIAAKLALIQAGRTLHAEFARGATRSCAGSSCLRTPHTTTPRMHARQRDLLIYSDGRQLSDRKAAPTHERAHDERAASAVLALGEPR
jgi:hypothetical protein